MNNQAKKLTEKTARGIVNLAKWRDSEIEKIELEIEALEAKKIRLKRRYNNTQLSLKFDVSQSTISTTVRGLKWKNL